MQDSIVLKQYGEPLEVVVRRSLLAKNISIKISAKGPELVLPMKGNIDKAYKFLLSKEYWVRQKLKKNILPKKTKKDEILFLGETYNIIHILSNEHLVKFNDNKIEIYSKDSMKNIVLQVFLKKECLKIVTELVNIVKDQHKLNYTNIRVMESISRWGSCSSKGSLSFNWRLIFAPKEVIKYLVVHEMAHLIEMNHSAKFWALVEKIYPEYQVPKLWLKKHGRELHHD